MEYKFDLLQNAVDSLKEAMTKFSEGSESNTRAYRFSVLHFSHFLELLSKHHVASAHPLLVFKNPSSKKIENENTIDLWDAIQFLRNEGKGFSADFNKDLEWLKKLKNNIEHNKFEMNVTEVRRALGRLIRATNEFNDYYELLDTTDHLDGVHLATYNQLADEYSAIIAKKKEAARERSEDGSIYDCHSCGELHTSSLINREIVCHLCGEIDPLVECVRCSQDFRQSEALLWNEEQMDYICEICRDRLISM